MIVHDEGQKQNAIGDLGKLKLQHKPLQYKLCIPDTYMCYMI